MRRTYFVTLIAFLCLPAVGQSHEHAGSRVIDFPDVDGFLSLTCDFHMHTVFSDGDVWPSIRVQEALRDGLDCIAITEHLEYQPHRSDIPHPDRNRAFDIARKTAGNSELIVIPGSEITREMPFGHANSIFIDDANPMLTEDAVDAFAEAHRQGAFTFINHPNWIPQRADGAARMEEIHLELIEKGQIQGIEVVNDITYSDEALELALKYNLTIMGTSDIHGLVDWQFDIPGGGHRPVTIVFARERTQASIHEALNDHRTAVWYMDTLIGRDEHVRPLIGASLSMSAPSYRGDSSVLRVRIHNSSEAEYTLLNASAFRFHDRADLLIIPGHHSADVLVKTGERLQSIELSFDVLSVVTAPGTHPTITLSATIGQ